MTPDEARKRRAAEALARIVMEDVEPWRDEGVGDGHAIYFADPSDPRAPHASALLQELTNFGYLFSEAAEIITDAANDVSQESAYRRGPSGEGLGDFDERSYCESWFWESREPREFPFVCPLLVDRSIFPFPDVISNPPPARDWSAQFGSIRIAEQPQLPSLEAEPGEALLRLGMSLEGLLVSGRVESITAHVSEAAAECLDGSPEKREETRRLVKELYAARSRYVHTGRIEGREGKKRSDPQLLYDCLSLVREILRRRIRALPDPSPIMDEHTGLERPSG